MPKDQTIRLRITPEEKATFEGCAVSVHLSLSAWIRQSLHMRAGSLKAPVIESRKVDESKGGENHATGLRKRSVEASVGGHGATENLTSGMVSAGGDVPVVLTSTMDHAQTDTSDPPAGIIGQHYLDYAEQVDRWIGAGPDDESREARFNMRAVLVGKFKSKCDVTGRRKLR